ncbi:alcohol dehydrogenase catalytic domain-containing protein [Paraburkholderia caledonica]|uniref:NADPH:quinone reductase-like Zn-dependent oxidoreductase n=1 Tax=Paraburkholderia caledonica TaxID=134536 RepID=A0ABU1KYZ7_9BURK|nr:NADPH:quinone reductase-like Zn-dependent oxidoreductase [Paraburkholderia caledonica]
MKTVRFHQTGGPEVLLYEDVATPEPGSGRVQIRVEAVGVNFADVLRRRGDDYPEPSPRPFTLGGEVAGRISKLGADVTGFAVGDLVYATTRTGCMRSTSPSRLKRLCRYRKESPRPRLRRLSFRA